MFVSRAWRKRSTKLHVKWAKKNLDVQGAQIEIFCFSHFLLMKSENSRSRGFHSMLV